MNIIKIIAFLGLSLVFILPEKLQAQNKETLFFADPLGDNMVIQQNKPFTVWGRAPKGTKVIIDSDWTEKIEVLSNVDGWFKGIIPVPTAAKGDYTSHKITIKTETETKSINNLLIGDLWICSGQSNMQFSLKESIGADQALKNADMPNLRLFNTGLNFSNTPIMEVNGKWKLCTAESAKDFSAVGYFFGKKLQNELQIPIGLVFTGIGASSAQAYVPKEVLLNDEALSNKYLKPYLESERSKEKIDGGFSFEKVTRPYLLYNALIHPFTNLAIKGVIWYQGEANRHERKDYTYLMFKMIESWRTAFNQGSFPFYYVQVAPYFYDIEDPKLADYAFFREAQENISILGNTEMVVTLDVGEAKDLHPKNKRPIGERLAHTALNQTYNILSIPYQGPQFRNVDFKGNKAIIHFVSNTVKSGLRTNDGNSPKYFQIAGTDKIFYEAEAVINADAKTISLSSNKIKHPVAARYAFTNYPVTNLENKDGLPALAFRSDSWEE